MQAQENVKLPFSEAQDEGEGRRNAKALPLDEHQDRQGHPKVHDPANGPHFLTRAPQEPGKCRQSLLVVTRRRVRIFVQWVALFVELRGIVQRPGELPDIQESIPDAQRHEEEDHRAGDHRGGNFGVVHRQGHDHADDRHACGADDERSPCLHKEKHLVRVVRGPPGLVDLAPDDHEGAHGAHDDRELVQRGRDEEHLLRAPD
mmetsp:Transcript_28093/g.76075  ORF Transcript_28093/g.76075 Transcript_28093/m.76075 type:complete len:203 (-) Transcript_28093:1143-1751(-)